MVSPSTAIWFCVIAIIVGIGCGFPIGKNLGSFSKDECDNPTND